MSLAAKKTGVVTLLILDSIQYDLHPRIRNEASSGPFTVTHVLPKAIVSNDASGRVGQAGPNGPKLVERRRHAKSVLK